MVQTNTIRPAAVVVVRAAIAIVCALGLPVSVGAESERLRERMRWVQRRFVFAFSNRRNSQIVRASHAAVCFG